MVNQLEAFPGPGMARAAIAIDRGKTGATGEARSPEVW